MKFGFNPPSGFTGEDNWKCWHTYTLYEQQRPTYTISSPMSLKAQVSKKKKDKAGSHYLLDMSHVFGICDYVRLKLAAQLQRLARGFKVRIWKLEVLYYPGSEQQRSWSVGGCAGWSVRLLFAYGKNRFSLRGSYNKQEKANTTGQHLRPSFSYFVLNFLQISVWRRIFFNVRHKIPFCYFWHKSLLCQVIVNFSEMTTCTLFMTEKQDIYYKTQSNMILYYLTLQKYIIYDII